MKRIQTRHLHEKTTPKASNWVASARPGALAVIPFLCRRIVKAERDTGKQTIQSINGVLTPVSVMETITRSVDCYKPFMVQVWGDWVGVEPLSDSHKFCMEHGAYIATPDPDGLK